ncbi:hypothetical protein LTR84_004670 [Exophiala bonariae]|uniref:Uncharacterized protein n=1 Tax=Exophiala bonariae TaxID=1690606 RepID=A0AAV9NQ26_9EURO|nr:hypothetical protein LTR84_004670 [Exophiala bonariae]
MGPLSPAASACAVIGAADVGLQAGTGSIRFLSDIKDAPAEVEKLRLGLQETTPIVEASKDYLETLNNGAPDS